MSNNKKSVSEELLHQFIVTLIIDSHASDMHVLQHPLAMVCTFFA